MKETCIFIDLGAGSLTISAIRTDNGHMKILSTVGESHWGGRDITKSLTSYCCEMYKTWTNRNLSEQDVRFIATQCEGAKLILNKRDRRSVDITLPPPYRKCRVTWNIIIGKNSVQLKNISNLLIRCMEEANIDRNEGPELRIVLFGRSSRLRSIRDAVLEFIPRNHFIEHFSNDRHFVAIGAALTASFLLDKHCRLRFANVVIDELIPTLAVRSRGGEMSVVIFSRSVPILSNAALTAARLFDVPGHEDTRDVFVRLYELERSNANRYVYIGMTQLSLPESHDDSCIIVSFRIHKNTFHVMATEMETNEINEIDILESEGFSEETQAPNVQVQAGWGKYPSVAVMPPSPSPTILTTARHSPACSIP
ncbi:hypothetical protein J6590_034854 [Homalodisca vitripennis]|nr:hypothetical protein J6590_034854 [Homalodisca vitripennis]